MAMSVGLSLKAVNLPDASLAFTNKVMGSAQDVRQLCGRDAGYVDIKGVVFTIEAHPKMEVGTVALNKVQREFAKIGLNADLYVKNFPMPRGFDLGSLKLEVDFLQKPAADARKLEIKDEDLEKEFRKKFETQVFASGQPVALDYESMVIKIIALGMSGIDLGTGEAPGKMMQGLLGSQTEIEFTQGSSGKLHILSNKGPFMSRQGSRGELSVMGRQPSRGEHPLMGGPYAKPSFGQGPGGFMRSASPGWVQDSIPSRDRAASHESIRSAQSGGSGSPRGDGLPPQMWGAGPPMPPGPPAKREGAVVRVILLIVGIAVAVFLVGALCVAAWITGHRNHVDPPPPLDQPLVDGNPPAQGEAQGETPRGPWHEGLDNVVVLSPSMGTASLQATVQSIFQEMQQDADGNFASHHKGQFGVKRRAILLLPGNYGDLNIPVSWYTTVAGVGMKPDEVVLSSVSSVDAYPGSKRGALENFWRAVEGVTLKDNTLWAVSQGASMRRCILRGDLWLSETDEEQGRDGSNNHYASGGFVADLHVHGNVYWGTQQQFFFRTSTFNAVGFTPGGQSMVFVGVEGSPDEDSSQPKPLVSNVDTAPRVAEKPYLVCRDGRWYIAVPPMRSQTRGKLTERDHNTAKLIPMESVFVARPGDSSARISEGIQGKHGLLLTPGIYGLDAPLVLTQPNFVVLGIGMPTLVATTGTSALVVQAADVRVAQVLLEAGTEVGQSHATQPLLSWGGTGGVASDLFARVGAFSYQTQFHRQCAITRADVMVQVGGEGVVLDNVWLWHADHDDCTAEGSAPTSDRCESRRGLIVNGDDVVAYGLSVEHTKGDLVLWKGERGQLFFFQAELPYRSNLNFGDDGSVGYRVADHVQSHTCYGVGVYQVFNTFSMPCTVRIPQTASASNLFNWCITDESWSSMGSLYCIGSSDKCYEGECEGNSCFATHAPNA